MARIIFIDSRLEVQPDQLKPKPRRRKQTDDLPSWEETQQKLIELYGEVPAILRGAE